MHLFYTPNINSDLHCLDPEESKHCVKVLRLQEGDPVILIDGKGGYYECVISDPNQKRCQVEVVKKCLDYQKPTFNLHIAIAPTKNIDRLEWFLEKATEIGISEITPLLCRYSERKVVKPDRMERIVVAAMKQSQKAYLPKINDLTSVEDFLSQTTTGFKAIAHCYEFDKQTLKGSYVGGDVVIMIGPEGDFSEAEVALAIQKGYKPVSLGESRLRTETAGVVACHTVNLYNQV